MRRRRIHLDALRSLLAIAVLITVLGGNQALVGQRPNTLQDPICQKQLEDVYASKITVQSPPQLTGIWTSTRCEVRSGPEFLLRKYRFFVSGLFELNQFYFSDSHCHRPSFAVEARGQFKLYQASWVIPGATEVDYQPRYVTLVPYTTDAAAALELQLNASACRLQSPWQPFERHVIFHYVEEEDGHQAGSEVVGGPEEDGVVDCLSSLDLSFHELQLVRVEETHLGPEDVQRSLLLGDVHPDRGQRTAYRPTGYQEPLTSAETVGCRVCRLVSKSSDVYPPQLPIRPRPAVSYLLPGSWVSLRCETRNYGVFLTRSVRFHDDGLLWERREYHFVDGLCQKPRYELTLRGTYQVGARTSELLEDAFNVDIQVLEVKLTIADKRLIKQLSQANTCGQPEVTWDVGVEQDVTSTHGCPALDIVTQPLERDVVLLDRQSQQQVLLYLGNSMPSTEARQQGTRPTSFLPPLVRCSGLDEPSRSHGPVDRLPYVAGNPEEWSSGHVTHGTGTVARASAITMGLASAAAMFVFVLV